MDFELSDDQVALTDGVRSFCEGRLPLSDLRGWPAAGGVDRAAWKEIADLGVFALRLPEPAGVGLGWADAVLVFEQLGRSLVPGPLVWTHLAAGLRDGVADGEVVVAGIERSAGELVEYAAAADALVVLDDDGLWWVERQAIDLDDGEARSALDPLTPVARRRGGLPQGEQLASADDARQLALGGAALVAGLHLGIAGAACDLAVSYAKDRQQFGRPIGSFQALKHIMADMLVRIEVARGAVYAAGVVLDDPEVGLPERAVAAARITAADAAIANGASCVQVHGGMGFTWEVDAHLYLERAYALETLFGSRTSWSERMADLMVVDDQPVPA